MNNYRKKYILFVLFLISNIIHAVSQPSGAKITEMQKAIVRVQSGNRIGSGFLWKNNNWVITTLHIIENQNNIEVTLANAVKSARVIKVLKEYDLVLLELDSPADALTTLSEINSNPGINSSLYTLGYNGKGNLNSIIDRTLRLGYNSNGKLEGLLPKKVRDALNICKRPNPAIEILYLEGSLLPGFSGSPIVDNSGRIVGVADGGLEEGASSISWGIKSQSLDLLLNSNEAFPDFVSCGDGQVVSFSSENLLEKEKVDYIAFKNFKFIKTKVRTVQEMMYTVDDPAGLQQIVNAYSMYNNINYLQFRYDIYEDVNSGITFCVPEGITLKIENDLIVGSFEGNDFKIIFWPAFIEYPNPNQYMRYATSSSQFQQKIVMMDGSNLTYQKDQNLSYMWGPVIKPDGTKLNREAYRGYYVTNDMYGQASYVPATYSFQAHAGKGNYYFGAAALNMNSTYEEMTAISSCVETGQCMIQNTSGYCKNICDRFRLFSQLVIGVHMGGFSNSYGTQYSQK